MKFITLLLILFFSFTNNVFANDRIDNEYYLQQFDDMLSSQSEIDQQFKKVMRYYECTEDLHTQILILNTYKSGYGVDMINKVLPDYQELVIKTLSEFNKNYVDISHKNINNFVINIKQSCTDKIK